MKKLYVIDASGYLYRSYFAIRNMTNSKGESTNALFGFIRSVQKLLKDFHPEHIVSVFDGPRNAAKRIAIYPQYKAHRAAMPADLRYQIEWAHKYCTMTGIPQLNVPDAEADDVMGSVAKWASKHDSEVFLCTSDKDMCQLVNDKIFILNTHKENQLLNAEEVEKIHGVPPNRIVDLLSIVGDSSDNVPGLPGFGPKTAVELLKSMGSLDYILAHPEEVPGKKKQDTIINEKEKALISRQLVTIDTDIVFPKEKDFFHLGNVDRESIKEFYSYMNFNTLLRELEQEKPESSSKSHSTQDVEYILVDDEDAFQELLKELKRHKEICFDTETTAIRPLTAELVGIGFGVQAGKAWYVPVNGKLGLKRVLEGVKPLFENHAIGFFGHNVKYDYHVLINNGIKVSHISFDTILASYLLNSHNRQHSLDALTLENFGKVKIAISDLIGRGKKQITMKEVPIPDICTYCCEDVDYTFRLKILFEAQLKERKLEKLYRSLELPLMPILAGMERHGIFLDVPHLEHSSKDVVHELVTLQKEVFAMAEHEFNLNSPAQLKKVLFEHLKIPYPKKRATDLSTNEEILQLLQNDYPIAGKILEYRKIEKLRSTYIETLPKEVNPKTHRIHCTFNQSGTATGRLACQDPNLQNIPVRSEAGRKIREAFRPEKKGWSYLSADYSQVELRLLAHLSEDPQLIESFHHNEDIHARTAAAIYNIPLKEVTKAQRHSAKAVNFGIIYGQQAYGLSQELGISPGEAGKFIETYFSRFTRVREFLESCKEKARKSGRAVTITGRERLIPEINSHNGMLRAQAERLAVNTPLQGTAADIIKMAMLKMDGLLHKENKLGYMILQIHDELIFEVPDFELLDFEPLVRESMERVVSLKVPLLIDITIGKNWKEC